MNPSMAVAAARRETRTDSFSLLAAFIATEAGLEVEGIPKASQLEADRIAAASVVRTDSFMFSFYFLKWHSTTEEIILYKVSLLVLSMMNDVTDQATMAASIRVAFEDFDLSKYLHLVLTLDDAHCTDAGFRMSRLFVHAMAGLKWHGNLLRIHLLLLLSNY